MYLSFKRKQTKHTADRWCGTRRPFNGVLPLQLPYLLGVFSFNCIKVFELCLLLRQIWKEVSDDDLFQVLEQTISDTYK